LTLFTLTGYHSPSLQTKVKVYYNSECIPQRLQLIEITTAGSLLGTPNPEDYKICLNVLFPPYSRSWKGPLYKTFAHQNVCIQSLPLSRIVVSLWCHYPQHTVLILTEPTELTTRFS